MGGDKQKTARALAVEVLNRFDTKRTYANVILDGMLRQTEEKQRTSDLVYGTIRNLNAIDLVVSSLGGCLSNRIPAKLLNTIRIGAYELIYRPESPDYAIVNEAVDNVKKIAGKKQASFTNVVLRNICRHIKERRVTLSQSNPKKTLPQTLFTGCEFDIDILPDIEKSPDVYLSEAFSLPIWLVKGWIDEYGIENARQICFAGNRRPSIYVRVNRLKTTTKKLAEKFCEAGIDFEITDEKSMIKLNGPQSVTDMPGFRDGLFSIQDFSAFQAASLLQPQPRWKILDLCAAPGTKTMQLAELTADKAQIYATDIDTQRLEKVRENAERLGVKNVKIVEYDDLGQVTEKGRFDAVLLDVPCSNTGVLAKRLEARFRIDKKAIDKLTKIQSGLLEKAAEMVAQHGKICYSTCSIESCENGGVVKDFLAKNKNFKLEKEKLTLPSAQPPDHDGSYAAVIKTK